MTDKKTITRELAQFSYEHMSLDSFINKLLAIEKKGMKDGYTNIKMNLDSDDHHEFSSPELTITGDRLETDTELKQRRTSERWREESQRKQDLKTLKELQKKYGFVK